jgi:hypothetical protein
MNIVPVHAVAQPNVLYIVATTATGTEAALRVASALAKQHSARLILIVPQIGPPAGSWPSSSTNWSSVQYQRLAYRLNQRVEVIVSVGSSVMDALRQRIPRCAHAIVGGRHRWWWPQREERVAAALRRSGRHALFVPETAAAGAIAAAHSQSHIAPPFR